MKNPKKPGRVKSAILNWLGVPIELTNGTFWAEWTGKSNSGQLVSAERSVQLSAVWACAKLIAETVSTLPFKMYEDPPDGNKHPAVNHPFYDLLCRQPCPDMTTIRFIQMIIVSILFRGNAFIEMRHINGRPVALLPLLPQNMNVSTGDNGRLKYRYTDPHSGVEREIARENIIHIRGFGLDGIVGLNPMKAGKEVLGSALATNEAAAKFFENGLQSSGFIAAKTQMNTEQRELLRKNLDNFVGSKNAGKVMVLEGDLDYKNITVNPETAQLIESREFSVEEICRWFGVPPVMIGHTSKTSSWASSTETLYTFFITTCLNPLLINIEQELKRCLLKNDDRYFFKFHVEGLLRADSTGRAAYYKQALQDGWMSRNEVREKEDLPPIPGGDKYTVQLNLTTLDKVGENSGE